MKMEALKSDILKSEILKQYKSLRQFSLELDIPYSTLVTALDRGIDGMAYGTVIRICEKLRLNPVDFTPLDLNTNISQHLLESEVMKKYVRLNLIGKKRILEMIDDFCEIDRFSKN